MVIKQILLVEDDAIARMSTERLLMQYGYQVIVAINARQAMEKVSSKIDLVLLDIGLPDMSGIEVAKFIRTSSDMTNQIPIIALTAHVLDDQKQAYTQVGINAVLSKPLFIEDLQDILDQLL